MSSALWRRHAAELESPFASANGLLQLEQEAGQV